jgi:hypothetical protein
MLTTAKPDGGKKCWTSDRKIVFQKEQDNYNNDDYFHEMSPERAGLFQTLLPLKWQIRNNRWKYIACSVSYRRLGR